MRPIQLYILSHEQWNGLMIKTAARTYSFPPQKFGEKKKGKFSDKSFYHVWENEEFQEKILKKYVVYATDVAIHKQSVW